MAPLSENDQNLIDYAYDGNLQQVHELLRTGDTAILQRNADRAPALWEASAKGRVEDVHVLLQNDHIDVNFRHPAAGGATALWIASHNGRVKVVRALLQDDRVNVHLPAIDGVTALDVARKKGHVDVVSLLVAHSLGVLLAVEETQLEEADDPLRSTSTAQPQGRNEGTPRTIVVNERRAAPPHRVVEALDEEMRENVEVHVTERDVLSGRGGRGNNHEGNRHYLQIVAEYASRYRESDDNELKNCISEAIVNDILMQGGRFLNKENGVHSWRVMEFEKANQKVKQALRDARVNA